MSELSGGNRSTDGEEATASTPDGDPIRRSVEVEYWVVDEGGRLTAPGDLVDAAPGVEREFVEPLLEIKTTPCESTEQLREELFGRISRVLERAETAERAPCPPSPPAPAPG